MRSSVLLIALFLLAHTSTAQASRDERPACFRFDSGWLLVFDSEGAATLHRLHKASPNWLVVNDRSRKQTREKKSELIAQTEVGTFDLTKIRREVKAAGKSSQTEPLVGFYFANFCTPDISLLPITPQLRKLFVQAQAAFEKTHNPRVRKLLRERPLLRTHDINH